MNAFARLVSVGVLAVVCSGPVLAQSMPATAHDPDPQASAAAALGNTVFLPVRLAVFSVGGLLGGATGFLTAGNLYAAKDIWDLFQGQAIITPAAVRGREAIQFGSLEFRTELQ